MSDYKNFNWQNIKQIKSYIIKSLNNRINNHLKKNKIKRSRLHQVCQNIYFQEASNEDEFIERYASIISILDKLTIDEHKFLDMHYSDGMTLKEIAAYLQKTEDSIKQKHRRLKAKIRLLLDVPPPANLMPIKVKKNNVTFFLEIVLINKSRDKIKKVYFL